MNRTSSRRRRSPLGRLTWPVRFELGTLLIIAALAGGVWGFLELGEEVSEGATRSVDTTLLLALRNPQDRSDPLGPRWLEEMFRDFTALGGVGVLTLLTLAVAGFLALERKFRMMSVVLIAVGGGLLLSSLLKREYERPRPDLVPHEAYVYTTSFPSGHSMMAAVTYLTLGALLARSHRHRGVKAYVLSLAIILTILVGVSRVYLGVHWPTDVLAGWTAGAVWAILAWLVTSWLQLHGRVEKETESAETR